MVLREEGAKVLSVPWDRSGGANGRQAEAPESRDGG